MTTRAEQLHNAMTLAGVATDLYEALVVDDKNQQPHDLATQRKYASMIRGLRVRLCAIENGLEKAFNQGEKP